MLLEWIIFLPIAFPLIGTLLFSLIAPRLSERARAGLPILWLVSELAAVLINIAPGTHRVHLLGWNAAAFQIEYQIDGVNLLLLLTLLTPLLAQWLILPPHRPFDPYATTVLTSAILLITAANSMTIYFTWAIFDLAIFLWRVVRDIDRAHALRALVIGQLAGLMFFAGTIAQSTQPSNLGAPLLAIAFWARLGLFPFHFLLPLRGGEPSDLWLARGIPLIAASNLWLHWSRFQADPPFILVGVLAVTSLIVTAVWLWRENSPVRVVSIATAQAITFVPLAITFGGEAGVALGLWLTLTAILALALFEIALLWRADNLNRWQRLIWFAALFSLSGLPLTPAFLGRVGVYIALWESNNGLMVIIAGLATLVVMVPLWGFGFAVKGSETREPYRIEYLGLVVIAIACAAQALLPMLIAHQLAPEVGNSAERAIDLVVRTDDIAGASLGILTLILPLIASFVLLPYARTAYLRLGDWIQNLSSVLDLEWAERTGIIIGNRASGLARNMIAITEENPTVWLLFVALWVAIFVLIAR